MDFDDLGMKNTLRTFLDRSRASVNSFERSWMF